MFHELVIFGIDYKMTETTLKSRFEKWGEIVDCVIRRDPHTIHSRGFGFITYKNAHMADDAEAASHHKIDGREIETKEAAPIEHNSEQGQFHVISIGGLTCDMTEERLKSNFEEWGEIVDCVIRRDPHTSRSRGCGFITYKNAHMADDAEAASHHKIDGREGETKEAAPTEKLSIHSQDSNLPATPQYHEKEFFPKKKGSPSTFIRTSIKSTTLVTSVNASQEHSLSDNKVIKKILAENTSESFTDFIEDVVRQLKKNPDKIPVLKFIEPPATSTPSTVKHQTFEDHLALKKKQNILENSGETVRIEEVNDTLEDTSETLKGQVEELNKINAHYLKVIEGLINDNVALKRELENDKDYYSAEMDKMFKNLRLKEHECEELKDLKNIHLKELELLQLDVQTLEKRIKRGNKEFDEMVKERAKAFVNFEKRIMDLQKEKTLLQKELKDKEEKYEKMLSDVRELNKNTAAAFRQGMDSMIDKVTKLEETYKKK